MITGLGIGGAERLVVSAATKLPPRFESAIVCLAERGRLADEAERAGVPVHLIGAFPGLRHPMAFARLVRTIRRLRPTIVHTHLQSANLYGRLAARLAQAPIVVSTEHNVYSAKAGRYVAVERMLAGTTDALIAVSEEVRRFLSEQLRIDPSEIRVVRNGVAAPEASSDGVAALRARLAGRPGRIRLATIASLTPKKGHDVLLRALPLLRQRGIECTLVLAGDGPGRGRLEALAAQLGIDDRVVFLGAVARPADVLAIADVFVLPSLIEGLPLALLEAMMAGKAVVATSVGGVPEAIQSGVNGILAPPGSEHALADAVASLIQSPELRDRLAADARASATRAYTEAAYLESLAAVYADLLTRRYGVAAAVASGAR